jgi:hypothetical protein
MINSLPIINLSISYSGLCAINHAEVLPTLLGLTLGIMLFAASFHMPVRSPGNVIDIVITADLLPTIFHSIKRQIISRGVTGQIQIFGNFQ